MIKDGVSVCITAYKAEEYIKECLDSVLKQTWFKKHKNWEIIVGIDGCEKTLEYMKTIMHLYKNIKVLMMDSNRGTYITSNSIMSAAKYENIFRFDSDDIMCPDLVETVMNNKDICSMVRYHFQNFGGSNKGKGVAHGTIYIKKSVFMKYGGFRPWPCGADTEIYYRLKHIENVKNIPDMLMLRRVHDESLTHAENTGMKSELRKKYKDFIEHMKVKKEEDAIIEMVTNTYKVVEPLYDGTVDKDEYMKNLKVSKYIPKEAQRPEPPKIRVTAIAQLRDDIAEGKVVKVHTRNGYVWKRIKK